MTKDLKVTRRSRCVFRVAFSPPERNAANHFVSRFLKGPTSVVVSAPLPDSWHALCAPSPYVKALKLYCGTTRILNDAGASGHAAAPVHVHRPPPFHVNAVLDIGADVRAMTQTTTDHVYVYGGLCDGRQKMPTLYSADAIRTFLMPLGRLEGRVFVPVTHRCVQSLAERCQHDDPIASAFRREAETAVEATVCPEKQAWLKYLLASCPGVGAAALAEVAALGDDIDVVLVPSMHYFMSNFTGVSCSTPAPRRCAQVRFSDFVGRAECPDAHTVRVGSSQTVHVTYSSPCDLLVATLGVPASVVIDGKMHALEDDCGEKKDDCAATFREEAMERVLRSLNSAEKIMASHAAADVKQAQRAAKLAAPLMKVYVESVVSGVFADKKYFGGLGQKMLGMLKQTLDHIFAPQLCSSSDLGCLKGPMRMTSIMDRTHC